MFNRFRGIKNDKTKVLQNKMIMHFQHWFPTVKGISISNQTSSLNLFGGGIYCRFQFIFQRTVRITFPNSEVGDILLVQVFQNPICSDFVPFFTVQSYRKLQRMNCAIFKGNTPRTLIKSVIQNLETPSCHSTVVTSDLLVLGLEILYQGGGVG